MSRMSRWALSMALFAMLIGCSMPDGPNPDGVAVQESADMPSEIPSEPVLDNPEITLNGPGQILPITATATIKGEQFDLEVAQNSWQQSLGLMFRSALPDNRGMLFPFSAPSYVFFCS